MEKHQTIASPHPSRKASGTFIIFLPRPSSLYLNRSWLIANIISPDNLGKEEIDPSLYSDATSPFTQQKLCHVVDIARRLKGLDNLCKNEGIHDNIDRVDVNYSGAWKGVDAMMIGDEQICAIPSERLSISLERPTMEHGIGISSATLIAQLQLWTLQQPFSRNSIPEDHIDKRIHLRNVVIRSLEDKSSAKAKLHFGDATNIQRSKDAFKDKRGICPRYRFKQNHLRFLGTFSDVRDQPGWILPAAAKILVNVTQGGDTDAWSGQVEGSEERGMFLYSAVEPA